MAVKFAHYPEAALEAYGKATLVVKDALARKHIDVTPTEYDRCQDYPANGFTHLFLKAIKNDALNKQDDYLISKYLDEVPGDFDVPEGRVPNEEQGAWILGFWGGRVHSLTPAQVAEKLEVSAPMVTKLLQQGKLDGVRIDGRWLITPHSVAQYRSEVQGKE